MVNIALVQPTRNLGIRYTGDLGLAYISAYLKNNRYRVRTFDASSSYSTTSAAKMVMDIADFVPEHILVKVWGFDYKSPNWIIEALKGKVKRKTNFIIGGQTATIRPEKSLNLTGADVGIIGDAIPLIYSVLHGEMSKKGVIYNQNGEVINNGEAELNPDNWPTPDLSDIRIRENGTAPLVSSVGCNHSRCSFCFLKEHPRRIKFRSIEKVVNDIESINQRWGIRHFYFYDDNFLNDPRRAEELAEAINEEMSFSFESRAESVLKSEKYLQRAKHKIRRIDIGVESFLSSQLERWVKGTTPQTNLDAINRLIALGIIPGMYMISADEQTDLNELNQTIDFFKENPFILFFLRNINRFQDHEQGPKEYPKYINVFQFALSEMASFFSKRYVLENILARIKRDKSLESLGSFGLKEQTKNYLNSIISLVRLVEEGSKNEEEAKDEARVLGIELAKNLQSVNSSLRD